MRLKNDGSWLRILFAFVVVLLVAGPGLGVSSAGNSYADPVRAVIVGPASATPTASFTLRVFFSDNTTEDHPEDLTAAKGSITNGDYTAPSGSGKDRISGSFTRNGITVSANKIISYSSGI
jgi:hypothetical protein